MSREKKECFVICPIGNEKEPERRRSDDLLKHIIMPVLKDHNYEAIRADLIPSPGIITRQIFEKLTSSELVIVDMTDYNPNVFYELAIRHTREKMPTIHMIETDKKIPFDVSMFRTIHYSTSDISTYKDALQKLDETLTALEENPDAYDNPFLEFLNIQKMKESENAYEKVIANMSDDLASAMTQIKQLKSEISELRTRPSSGIWYPQISSGDSNTDLLSGTIKWDTIGQLDVSGTLLDPNADLYKPEEKKKGKKID